MSASKLVESIQRLPGDGQVQNELLELMRGEPDLQALSPLLAEGASEPVLRAGLFVLSELGQSAKVGLEMIRPLYSHPSPRVRMRLVEILHATRAEAAADLEVLATCLDADEAFLVRAAAKAFLRFPRSRVLEITTNKRCHHLLAFPDIQAENVRDQLLSALGFLLEGDVASARKLGNGTVGLDLVQSFELQSRLDASR